MCIRDRFKCVNAKGVASYQQLPCPANSKKASVRYVAPVADTPRASWSGQAERSSQVSYSNNDTSRQQSGTSNYERDEAKRRQDIEASEYAMQNRRSSRSSRSTSDQPLYREPTTTQIRDYNGNTY